MVNWTTDMGSTEEISPRSTGNARKSSKSKYSTAKRRPRCAHKTRKNGVKLDKTKVSNAKQLKTKNSEPIIPNNKQAQTSKNENSEHSNRRPKITKPISGKGNLYTGKGNKIKNEPPLLKYSEPINPTNKITKPTTTTQNRTAATPKRPIKFYSLIKIILSNDVETNPGPNSQSWLLDTTNNKNLTIVTYNVQGCKEYSKLKRVINFFHRQRFKQNCIINLQETHLENTMSIKYHWKYGDVQSISRQRSGGVAILFNEQYFDAILDKRNDNDGRICSFTASKNNNVTTYVNIYAPNDHYKTSLFLEQLEEYVYNIKDKYPNTQLIISGDFNFIFNKEIDAIGRNSSKQEEKVSQEMKRIMERHSLFDTYRQIHKWGGFTWGRDNPQYIRSRLDHILISKSHETNLIQCYTTKVPNESDHSLLYIEIDNDETDFGPGIIRCNSTLLDEPEIYKEINEQIKKTIEDLPQHWNPHQRLDYVKINIRNLMIKAGKIRARQEKTELDYNNREIDSLNKKMEELLIKANHQKQQNNELLTRIDKIRQSIKIVEEMNEPIKENYTKKLIFRSKAKWAEKGEKSNKYFLNLLKLRQKRLQIRKIIANGTQYTTQDEISKAITNFYKKLYKRNDNLKDIQNDTSKMFEELPKLNDKDKKTLEKPISKEELYEALKTCTESAPGPDGITYGIYKKLWHIMGDFITDSWKFSNEIGSLSSSQRDSVINLLEKKDKDKTKIENLRPISLSNCDIKICTKAIALRTNPILKTILHENQTGYVPGKQITDNCRLIEEIIDYMEKNKKDGYLITLDAQKAFDSVDHKYLLDILRKYGFPPQYISWVKMIYTNLRANVMINGYISNVFHIERSVKQGDALSCALFVIAIDPLLRAIENDKRITPIKLQINNADNVEIKSVTFADDITAFCTSADEIKYIIELYNEFSKYSGIELNIPKTEILKLGPISEKQNNHIIRDLNKSHVITESIQVKICGATFSNKKELMYQDNIIKKIDKLSKQLNIWKQRNLTLEGKILIIKTFGLSQLIYSLQISTIEPKELKEIDNIIYRFIWNTKASSKTITNKIKKATLRSDYSEGGLKAPDIFKINEAIKYKQMLSTIHKDNQLSKYVKSSLQEAKFEWNMDTNINLSILSKFYQNAVTTHKKLTKLVEIDINSLSQESVDIKINKMYYAYIQEHKILNSTFINQKQKHLVTKVLKNNIITYRDLLIEQTQKNNPSLWFEVMQLLASFPKSWKVVSQRTKNKHTNTKTLIPIKENIWKQSELISLNDITKRLSTQHTNQTIKSYIEQKHRIAIEQELSDNPFTSLRTTIKEIKLRNVQYKILHNIYPTQKHLHKWKLSDNPNCRHCIDVPETIIHAIYECPIAIESKANLERCLEEELGEKIELDKVDMLVGIQSGKIASNNKKQKTIINAVTINLKRKLILQRDNKTAIEVNEIKNLINYQKKLTSYIEKSKENSKR
jgi:exonuclease III